MKKPLLILIAGPYRSGTNDDPTLLQANVDAMNQEALRVWQRGHLPLVGEWFALPLVETAGSQRVGDAIFNEIFHPIAVQLLDRCDAVLRISGASIGADEMTRIARQQGKLIFGKLDEIPQG